MPLHEYQCPACGKRFEKLCRSAKENLNEQPCPECGHPRARRTLSRVGAVRGQGSAAPSNCGNSGGGFS